MKGNSPGHAGRHSIDAPAPRHARTVVQAMLLFALKYRPGLQGGFWCPARGHPAGGAALNSKQIIKGRRRSTPGSLLAVCLAVFSLLSPTGLATAGDPGKPSVIFLVRHAEKQVTPEDPSLTEAGHQRAQALADLLQHSGIERIYSTDFVRTRETATPLADRLGLPVTIYDWEEMEDLAVDLKAPGRRSLVVGHSDTTPELVEILGGDPGAPIDEQAEYDRLYVVTIATDGGVTAELRRYGAH